MRFIDLGSTFSLLEVELHSLCNKGESDIPQKGARGDLCLEITLIREH